MEKIVKEIKEFKSRIENTPINNEAQTVDRETFTLLLSGMPHAGKFRE